MRSRVKQPDVVEVHGTDASGQPAEPTLEQYLAHVTAQAQARARAKAPPGAKIETEGELDFGNGEVYSWKGEAARELLFAQLIERERRRRDEASRGN